VTEAPNTIGWGVAFLAGLLSFLSPCVAPIVPGYLSLISGAAIGPGGTERRQTERVTIASGLFVLGFSFVFVVLGATAGALGGLLGGGRTLLSQISGLVMIAMGLVVLGAIGTPMLYRERRVLPIDRPFGPVGAVLVGMAFGLGWTPCIGPVLASILLYAGTAETARDGGLLLLAYSLGLGLPFIGAGLAFSRGLTAMGSLMRHVATLNRMSGLLLIGLGALFLTNQASYLTYMNVAAQRLVDSVVR